MGIIGISHNASWEKAPKWAKWKAQDADGSWSWFSTRPQPNNWGLYEKGTFLPFGKGKKKIIKTNDGVFYWAKPNPNWRETIEKRPKDNS